MHGYGRICSQLGCWFVHLDIPCPGQHEDPCFASPLALLFCRLAAEAAEQRRLAELERQRLEELRRQEVRNRILQAPARFKLLCTTCKALILVHLP